MPVDRRVSDPAERNHKMTPKQTIDAYYKHANAGAWDATTAGVLTVIRDALVTHGLIAAA